MLRTVRCGPLQAATRAPWGKYRRRFLTKAGQSVRFLGVFVIPSSCRKQKGGPESFSPPDRIVRLQPIRSRARLSAIRHRLGQVLGAAALCVWFREE